MAARSIASLSLSFGLVSIPIKLYSATETSADVRFNFLTKEGSRIKMQYISEQTGEPVERSELKKGYEFDKDQFVVFAPEELKALDDGASHVVDIVAFIPEKSVDPIFYDKAYFIAPDKRGGKPYNLLKEALRKTGRCALAKWSFKGHTHMVQIRPAEDGLVFQQLLFADEVRSLSDLNVERMDVSDAELKLAIQIIDQASQDTYDPTQYKDEEKERVLHAIDEKIAGKQIVTPEAGTTVSPAGQVIDLMEALRASLVSGKRSPAQAKPEARDAAPKKRAGATKSATKTASHSRSRAAGG
ncbi:Ku protein [Lacisediminimonas sp.]|uniref:non-homologous end joining protein Ku n=1 Tax=Lacisediminimonas sp. TaxID=3060582 RepID=UPI00271BCF58|nr:Ku protein [Lacisediminimonas sp.]MDO8298230.1 Ku protein [Lacisediminimonas sp.]